MSNTRVILLQACDSHMTNMCQSGAQ